MTMSETDVPGLDLAAFATYFDTARPGTIDGPLRASVLPGGKSNITYDVTDGEHHWVVRRPPLGHVLATAHDMGREYRVISALAGTNVPVPETSLLCDDPAVIGAPFYVMPRSAGTAYRTAAQLEAVGAERTRVMATRMIDTLADLHAVQPAAVGLADFGRPEGFLGRQVRRWKQQLDASRSRDLPGADELHAALGGAVPGRVRRRDRARRLPAGQPADRGRRPGDRGAGLGDGHPRRSADRHRLAAGLPGAGPMETGYAVADAAIAPGFPDAAEIARRLRPAQRPGPVRSRLVPGASPTSRSRSSARASTTASPRARPSGEGFGGRRRRVPSRSSRPASPLMKEYS